MADWATIAQLATAGGTLVLAGATFAAVRSSRRSTQITERALLAATRPVLVTSRLQDPVEKVGWIDGHWAQVDAGRGVAEATEDVVYLSFGLRNVGSGLAVLDRWDFVPPSAVTDDHGTPGEFVRLTRDIYVPGGDVGIWQGAFRDPTDPRFVASSAAIAAHERFAIDLLYGDHEGGQRTISRFAVTPDGEAWITTVSRHWNLDRADPR